MTPKDWVAVAQRDALGALKTWIETFIPRHRNGAGGIHEEFK